MYSIKAKHKAGTRLIANRYVLNDCLFASTLGTLYLARDTRAGSKNNTPQVLIHQFPARILDGTSLQATYAHLQQLGKRSNSNILPIIDCGWMEAEAYFVLESPQSWSLSTLPPPETHLTSVHEKAIQLLEQLIAQNLVHEGLLAYLFLVTPDGDIHLPGTALSKNLQALQIRHASFLSPNLQTAKKRRYWLFSKGFWLSSTSLVLAGGLSFYYAHTLTAGHDSRFASSLNARESSLPVYMRAVNGDEPKQFSLPISLPIIPRPRVLITEPEPATAPPVPAHLGHELIESIEQTRPSLNRFPPELLVSLNTAAPALTALFAPAMLEPETPPVPDEMPEPEPLPVSEETPEPKLLPAPKLTPGLTPKPTPLRVDKPSAQVILSHTRPAPPPVVVQPTHVAVQRPVRPTINTHSITPPTDNSAPAYSGSPELTANGMTSTQLIQRAYTAIHQGQLDERANHGAVYFIRLLHRIDRGNPQIQRLAREVSYQYHQRTRNAMGQQAFDLAERYLLMAKRVIKEFNLVQLNPAQAILEHKLARE